jgi:hypothetical protein
MTNSATTAMHGQKEQRGEVGNRYNPCHGSRYDSSEDQSRCPPLPGPQVFSRHILSAPIPARYHPPANIQKYVGETNPALWLKDY